jgi:hypothetical protein
MVKQYGVKESKAASTIQKYYRLKKLWSAFVKNPDKYAEFTNDELAYNMFGQHVAGFEINSKMSRKSYGYMTRSNAETLYYRFANKDTMTEDSFKMMPEAKTVEVSINTLGTVLSRWKKNILATRENRFIPTKTLE